ncbi:MAG: tripartite tricarboxylate transporter substrate-binding protein [Bauldia sp.]
MQKRPLRFLLACTAVFILAGIEQAAAAWEPTKAVEIIVPFVPGGASDQMARTMQGIIEKYKFVKTPIVVTNKPAASGGEAMLDIQASAGDPHKLLTTSSGIYMTPLSTKLPVNWKDFTPVAMVAQDEFVLWVNANSPWKTTKDFVAAAKAAATPMRFGGAGAKREDELLVFASGQAGGFKSAYIPYGGGAEASTQLAGNHIEANTNNPSEEIANWRAGLSRPLCVYSSKRMGYTDKVTATQSWSDIPTCPTEGLNATYQMLRGLFMPGKVTADQQAFYVDLLKKVTDTPEWKDYVARSALLPDFRSGKDFVDFLTTDEKKHIDLMNAAGMIAK